MNNPNNLSRLLELNDSIGLFENTENIDGINFSEDVPESFIKAWKNKIAANKEFNKELMKIKASKN